MITHELENVDLYVSERVSEEELLKTLGVQNYVNRLLSRIFDNYPDYQKYVDLWGKLNELPRIGILDANGEENGGWKYYDKKGGHPVSRWVSQREREGKYSGLILHVCNPGRHIITPKKSVLIIPDRDVHTLSHQVQKPMSEDTCFSIFTPSGELDPYKIETIEIPKLKERLGAI